MNIAIRKLALLEQNIKEQEEADKIRGYSTVCVDGDFRRRLGDLMDRVRVI